MGRGDNDNDNYNPPHPDSDAVALFFIQIRKYRSRLEVKRPCRMWLDTPSLCLLSPFGVMSLYWSTGSGTNKYVADLRAVRYFLVVKG